MRSKVRSSSGVLPITIYTKPHSCGGACIYCPSVPGYPRSYLENEDTLEARGFKFDAGKQFQAKIFKLPHSLLKPSLPYEVIILGGSFSSLPYDYRREYIESLYCIMDGGMPTGRGRFRCSVLTVESRPDQINEMECRFLRSLGVTKVEIGAQHLKDDVLIHSGRGHSVNTIKKATRLLKNHGFKVGYHLMLGLPGADKELDSKMLKYELWSDEFNPDYLKIYPCVLLKDKRLQPLLWREFDNNNWIPPNDEYSSTCVSALARGIPKHVRVSRIQRQFDDESVYSGVKTGLRERLNISLEDIRSREVGIRGRNVSASIQDIKLSWTSKGRDQFLHAELRDSRLIAGIARVRQVGQDLVLRELKVFGSAGQVGLAGQIQGRGLGKLLLRTVEESCKSSGIFMIRVNSSVGAKSFFTQEGYTQLPNGFLFKSPSGEKIGSHQRKAMQL